jgi:hypothetical protein
VRWIRRKALKNVSHFRELASLKVTGADFRAEGGVKGGNL